MRVPTIEELVSAGVHFGHPTSSWNPKMRPYIFGRRNNIHLIDVRETLKGIVRACHFLTQVAAAGEEILLVGTKRQAKQLVEELGKSLGCPYVSERWPGGLLTNYETIRQRLKTLEHIEYLEESGLIQTYSKKMIGKFLREKRKITRNLGGVRHMKGIPSTLVVVDPKREHIAVKEADKLGVVVVALIDTDSDPDLVDIPIPTNDDSYRSISLILQTLSEAIRKGKSAHIQREEMAAKVEEAPEEKEAPKKVETKKIAKKRKTVKAVSPKKEEEEKVKKETES